MIKKTAKGKQVIAFNKTCNQLIIYFLVGSFATIIEWSAFYIFDFLWKWHYAVAFPAAFVMSTFANWCCGRYLLFKKGNPKGLWYELLFIYAVSTVGLTANILIMWILIDHMAVHDMIAKIIATGIVFLGNFAVRKIYIYKI